MCRPHFESAANRAHQGNLRIMRAEGGVFSPAQFHQTVKASSGERLFAREAAPGQEPSNAAKSQRVPDSGSPGRLLQGHMMHGGPLAGMVAYDPILVAKLGGAWSAVPAPSALR